MVAKEKWMSKAVLQQSIVPREAFWKGQWEIMVSGVPGSSRVMKVRGLRLLLRERALGRQKQLKNKPVRFCRGYRRLGRRPARGEKVKKLSNEKMQKKSYIARKDCNVI